MGRKIEDIRKDFPQLTRRQLVYLDSASTTLKPQVVSQRMIDFLQAEVSNVHRGIHHLSHRATENYEATRRSVAQFIGASEEEVVFTKGTTEAINLVSHSLGESLSPGDEIVVTEMEHHSNFLPWQWLCQKRDLCLKVACVKEDGTMDLNQFKSLLTAKTRVVCFSYISNVLGMKNPVEEMVEMAKKNNSLTLIDGAQAVSCLPINVKEIGCDFFAFSAHKLFGPFGVGILWGKGEVLDTLAPYQKGGGMISQVDLSKSTYLSPPHRFEAGTPNISGVVAFQSALEYFTQMDLKNVLRHESDLVQRAYEGLKKMGSVRFIGDPYRQINLISFVMEGIHSEDMGSLIDQQGVAIRVGHHCAQPLMKRFGLTGTLRASFSIYNNHEDVDVFLQSVKKAKELLS